MPMVIRLSKPTSVEGGKSDISSLLMYWQSLRKSRKAHSTLTVGNSRNFYVLERRTEDTNAIIESNTDHSVNRDKEKTK